MRTTRQVRSVLLGVMVVSTVGCDQVTKHIARTELVGPRTVSLLGGVLRLALAQNTGGFLSFGASWPGRARAAVFVFGVGLVLLLATFYVLRRPRLSYLGLVGPTLLCAGGLSNLLDRILRGGHVTDFIIVGLGPAHTGVFNVADLAITVGGAVLIASHSCRRKTDP